MALASLVSFQEQKQNQEQSGFQGSMVEYGWFARRHSLCKWLYCLDILIKKLQTPSQKRSGKRQKEWSNISDFWESHPEYSFFMSLFAHQLRSKRCFRCVR